jgi:hypothetical protein
MNMCKGLARNFCNDTHQQYSTGSITRIDQIDLVLDQPNHTSLEEQSCLTTLNRWYRNVYRRVKRPDDKNNQPAEINIGKSIHPPNRTQDLQCKTQRRNLFPFKRPYRTIKITDKSSVSLACNGKHILLKQTPNLCLLDKQLTILKMIPWTYDHVDMCWSSTLDQFILITDETIFTLDENTMMLDRCQIRRNNEKQWSCGSCSDTSLYLSTGDMSAILYQYTLQPSIEFVKEWQLFALHPAHEGILTFICRNGTLALIISNINIFQRRLDLRSSTTLERLWSIPLDAVAHCCSINDNQWIVMELLKPRLLHISSDGKILQEYKIKPTSVDIIWNAIQLDDDTIVTFTMTNLNLHKLS